MDFLEPALPLKADYFAEIGSVYTYNIRKEGSDSYTITIF